MTCTKLTITLRNGDGDTVTLAVTMPNTTMLEAVEKGKSHLVALLATNTVWSTADITDMRITRV